MPANPRSALEVHHALKTAIAVWEQAEHNTVVCFAEVLRRRLYLELGYSSIQQYARVELKFSDTRTGDFVRLARKMAELPVLREAIENGDVGYTKAREIITVATPKTEAHWVDAARGQSRAALADKIKKVRDKAARRRKADPAQTELLPVPTETPVREVPVHVHHIASRELGGDNGLSNLITLCSGCHRQHHDQEAIRRPWAPRR